MRDPREQQQQERDPRDYQGGVAGPEGGATGAVVETTRAEEAVAENTRAEAVAAAGVSFQMCAPRIYFAISRMMGPSSFFCREEVVVWLFTSN